MQVNHRVYLVVIVSVYTSLLKAVFYNYIPDNVKLSTSVPTLKFALFLYLQQIQKISLRASLVSGSDEYPLINNWFVYFILRVACTLIVY